MLETLVDEQNEQKHNNAIHLPVVLGWRMENSKSNARYASFEIYSSGTAVKAKGDRYADYMWPGSIYPDYVSGGGYYMNFAAMELFRELVRLTPMIPIDDALTGVVFQRSDRQEIVTNQVTNGYRVRIIQTDFKVLVLRIIPIPL